MLYNNIYRKLEVFYIELPFYILSSSSLSYISESPFHLGLSFFMLKCGFSKLLIFIHTKTIYNGKNRN